MSKSSLPLDLLEIEINPGMIEEHRYNGIPDMGRQRVHMSALAIESPPLSIDTFLPTFHANLEEKQTIDFIDSELKTESRSFYSLDAAITLPYSAPRPEPEPKQDMPVDDEQTPEEPSVKSDTALGAVRAFLESDSLSIVVRDEKLATIVWLLSEQGSPLVASAEYFSLYGEMSDDEAQKAVGRLVGLGILEERKVPQEGLMPRYSLADKGHEIAKILHHDTPKTILR